MSTTTSSTLPRAYIGARRSRQYINNYLNSSSLLNDNYSPTTGPSKSFQSIQSAEKNDLTNEETIDTLQTQQEEQDSIEHLSSTTPLDKRQFHLQQERKAKGFLPSTSSSLLSSSSSSLFLSQPTTHNVTPLSCYDYSPPYFAKEQQHFYHPSQQSEQHSYWQPLSSENKNNQLLLLEECEPHKEEQQKHKQSSANALSIRNQNAELSNIPEEKNSFSSLYALSDPIVQHKESDNQSHLLTSTPILPFHTSYRPTTTPDNFVTSLPADKQNNNKSLPFLLDNLLNQSSPTLTDDSITNSHHTADIRKLNNMSSFRHSSIASHPYDQRISDQGNKYIIQLKTDEYQENEFVITPRHSLNQLIIDAKHREEDSSGGYIHRELHKIFIIPKHIDLNQYAYTYNTNTQELTIEMPYLPTTSTTNENRNHSSPISSVRHTTEPSAYSYENRNSGGNILPTATPRSNYYNTTNGIGTTTTDSTLLKNSNTTAPSTYQSPFGNTKPFDFDLFRRSVFRPQIVGATSIDNNNNVKKLIMSLDLSDYQAEDIKVTVKNRELIVNAERKIETGTRKSRSSFYQSTSLPPQTDIEQLQTNYINGKLTIEAPYLDQSNLDRRIKTIAPISHNQQGSNWRTVTELQEKTTNDDLFQQRTETVKECVRVCGLRTHSST